MRTWAGRAPSSLRSTLGAASVVGATVEVADALGRPAAGQRAGDRLVDARGIRHPRATGTRRVPTTWPRSWWRLNRLAVLAQLSLAVGRDRLVRRADPLQVPLVLAQWCAHWPAGDGRALADGVASTVSPSGWRRSRCRVVVVRGTRERSARSNWAYRACGSARRRAARGDPEGAVRTLTLRRRPPTRSALLPARARHWLDFLMGRPLLHRTGQ